MGLTDMVASVKERQVWLGMYSTYSDHFDKVLEYSR